MAYLDVKYIVWRLLVVALFSPMISWAGETNVSLLNNHFLVDSTIKKVSFLIYRESSEEDVVLVAPDRTEYNVSNHPDNIRWYETDDINMILITNPMRGFWQVNGRINPKNKVNILSDITLRADLLPRRLYQSEILTLTVRLQESGQPLTFDDLTLNVVFIPYEEKTNKVESELVSVLSSYLPITKSIHKSSKNEFLGENLGTFEDDGKGIDEVKGDGVFTVRLPMTIEPGRYIVQIQSKNRAFVRTIEKKVLVAPSPIQVNFIQSENHEDKHRIEINLEGAVLNLDSLVADMKQIDPSGTSMATQARSERAVTQFDFDLPNSHKVGKNLLLGSISVSEKETNRALQFRFPTQAYFVKEPVDVDMFYEAKLKEELETLREGKVIMHLRFLCFVLFGNIASLIFTLGIIFGCHKIRNR